MSVARASVIAVLGPTNTGKTHLAVERMCAHSSGMMGFPLRLLAREIYDRMVLIKGAALVALITGEERIEPVNARYYCCTVESMLMEREFAFVAIDEAQLGADPERGHIFTDRILHARGREETMILGSDSLRPMIRALLPEAEIISRPRFSQLSYAGVKKLSRLPKRAAIVAFSIEQVYAVAEMLRRLRGGAAVVMGALSPRTRNAQVAMFQSGEVDYLVATDAIGMGLNLDVAHVAFASLSKFDGARRRRLTTAEMAQIAGRAGRHQRDGSFGTLAGESSAFLPEEIIVIEEHHFPKLDWLYWRESRPRFDTIEMLIADLEAKPDRSPLRAAPVGIDLDVLKRLADNPEARKLATNPAKIARLWEAASLPDFRQMGAEYHARFVASLWQSLGAGNGALPDSYVASELARLDNVQGDIATLSARIAAVRTWTYIAHRKNWLTNPMAMAQRAQALEEKLSDALHAALKQRFVDKRMAMLLRKQGRDDSYLPVHIDSDNQVFVDGEGIGRLEGFAFHVDPRAKASDRKLMMAAAEHYLRGILKQKVKDVSVAEDIEFHLGADHAGRPAVFWQQNLLGNLTAGKTLMQPVFQPVKAVAELDDDSIKNLSTRAEAWVVAQLEKHMGGIVALHQLSQDANVEGAVRALAVQLAGSGGIAPRSYLTDALVALPKEARGAARKSGIIFGALDVYHHSALKPGAVRWRVALFAARENGIVAALPPESAVHLKEWKFASAADCRNAGYRRIGSEHIRIDLAERIIKKAHEARGTALTFGMDMAFATSLGLSTDGLEALMRDAGFRAMSKPDDSGPDTENTVIPETSVEAAIENGDAPGASATPAETVAEIEAKPVLADPILTYWRWIGIRKPKPAEQRKPSAAEHKARSTKNKSPKADRTTKASTPPPSPPSSLALQLAALQALHPPKSR